MTRYGRLGASSRLRSYQYLPFMKKHGIEIEIAPLLDDNYIEDLYSGKGRRKIGILGAYLRRAGRLFGARHFDLIWIEKELFPWVPAWGEVLLDALGIPYVVDYDDAIFHNYDLHPNRLVRFCLGTKIDQVIKRAAVVVVGNDYLGDRARRAGAKRVEYLPTVIDLERYQMALKPRETPFTIGWIGSPATAKYIQLVQPALSEVCRNGKARVVLVGSGPVKLADVPVVVLPWSEDSEVAAIQGFDVGIMPLPDEPWERGKCGYKLIQYMACGRPVIASPVGINRQIVEQGVNGFLASDMTDWVTSLNELRDNASLRESMGRAGRSKVEKQYCVQVTAPRLAEILQWAAGR
jgi:glycosyltransferase involved in cell wall biosynthesis